MSHRRHLRNASVPSPGTFNCNAAPLNQHLLHIRDEMCGRGRRRGAFCLHMYKLYLACGGERAFRRAHLHRAVGARPYPKLRYTRGRGSSVKSGVLTLHDKSFIRHTDREPKRAFKHMHHFASASISRTINESTWTVFQVMDLSVPEYSHVYPQTHRTRGITPYLYITMFVCMCSDLI